MYFSEFFFILQSHFAKPIGNEELGKILFDFVIIPANIQVLNKKEDKKDILTIEKGQLSRILNHKAVMHGKIREHIYDKPVIDSLVKNFQEDIVSELSPDVNDLCFQMMEIIKEENISPESKAEFEMLAKPETIAPFLAKVFVYSIVTNGENHKAIDTEEGISNCQHNTERASNLILSGINMDNRKLDKIYTDHINNYLKIDLNLFKDDLKRNCEEVSFISLKKEQNGFSFSFLYDLYKIPEKEKKVIEGVAKQFNIELSEDFFDFGRLSVDSFSANLLLQSEPNVIGSEEEKRKYKLVKLIYSSIIDFSNKAAFYNSFYEIKYLALALTNNGNDYDEDVRITLKLPKDSILTPEEIANFDQTSLIYLVDGLDQGLEIDRGLDFVSYKESKKISSINISARKIISFGERPPVKLDDIKDLFEIYIGEDNNNSYVEVFFDKINQHTSVAFPNLILLRKEIKNIEYTIKSKNAPNIITGEISVLDLK